MKRLFIISAIIIFTIISFEASAQWTQCNGPWQGNVKCFTQSGNSTFAGTVGDGIYFSTDSGIKWRPLNPVGLSNNGINCFMWAGTNLFAGTDGGVFLSTDGGNTWFAVNSGLYNNVITSLAKIGSKIFAGTSSGVFISSDNGAFWYNSSYGMTNYDVRCLLTDGDFLYAGTGGGIFKSTDNGNSWISSNFGLISQDVYALLLNGSTIFAGTSSLSNAASIYKSTDDGNSWNSSGLPNKITYSLFQLPTGLYAGTGDGVYRSTDNGVTWSSELGMGNTQIKAVSSSGTNIVLGNPDGLFVSTNNGTQWKAVGYKPTYVWSIDGNDTQLWATVAQHDVFYSTDNGDSWLKRINDLDPAYRYIDITCSDSGVYAAYINNNLTNTGIYKTTDNGLTWNWLYGFFNRSINTIEAASDSLILIGLYYRNGEFGFYGLNPFTYYSTFGIPNQGVGCFAVKDDVILAGTNGGIYRSTDGTTTWVNVGGSASCFAVSGNNIFAASDGVFLSTDDGITWSSIGLLNKPISSLAAFGNNVVAAVFSEGIMISTDLGATWNLKNDGLDVTPSNVTDLYVKDGMIFAAIDQLSFWKRSLTNISDVEETKENLPIEFSLYQNYPNPFNPTTNIGYEMPVSSYVTIKVYDVLGKEVATLIDGHKPAGSYEVEFDGKELTSGIYFYQLTTRNFIQTKKMILIK